MDGPRGLVSIPLWFDSNHKYIEYMLNPPKSSQFHYGSIQTNLMSEIDSTIVEVSIPLWFDSNLLEKFQYGLIQLVSIPLWFDSNKP